MLRASAALLQLTSIYGNEKNLTPSQSPYSFFLELDDVSILLDCGWDEDFSSEYLEKLLPFARRADAVLLSSPHMNACGALPFVLRQLKPQALVYSASSTSKVGLHGLLHPFLYRFPNNASFSVGDENFELTVDSIYSAFRSVREPFGGKVVISARNSPVECLTHFASRMLGGYSWTIKYQIDELLYCPDYSTRLSYCLKKFSIPSTPNILLIESFSAERKESTTRKKYEEHLDLLFKEIQHTLRSGSDVLIPVDVPGRGIEVLNIIVHLLQEKGGDKYKIVLASIQAQELLDKAATMTEAFQDGVILSESGLFSSVVPCKNAIDVQEVGGPKICIADGATMNFGLSAELLSVFLRRNADGGKNLIVFTECPPSNSNAFKVYSSSMNDVIDYEIIRRCSLNREELEEYYVNMEQEAKTLQTDSALIADENVNSEDDDNSDDDGANFSRPDACVEPKNMGLYTTQPLKQSKMKFLQFASIIPAIPLLDHGGKMDLSYGVPVSAEEELLMKKLSCTKIISDEGPESLILTNDAQTEANLPSKVFTEFLKVTRECKIFVSDLSGYPDSLNTVKTLLKTKFSSALKVVCLRSSEDTYRIVSKFCRSEKSMKCGENVYFAHSLIPVKLDTPLFSYTVKLDSNLEHQLPRSLKRVRESSSHGDWEVGWVDGCLTSSTRRVETQPLGINNNPVLTTVPDDRVEGCAIHRRAEGLERGSFFVGNVDLNRVRDMTRRELHSDFYQKAPLLVFNDGVCVRRSIDGSITISSIPTPSMFEVRRTVYDQFFQVL